jgi:hypothetical protein
VFGPNIAGFSTSGNNIPLKGYVWSTAIPTGVNTCSWDKRTLTGVGSTTTNTVFGGAAGLYSDGRRYAYYMSGNAFPATQTVRVLDEANPGMEVQFSTASLDPGGGVYAGWPAMDNNGYLYFANSSAGIVMRFKALPQRLYAGAAGRS